MAATRAVALATRLSRLTARLQLFPVARVRRRVAVVDDEESVRKALLRLLRSAGMDVQTFASGAEFLESMRSNPPDCLVLDLHMPGVDGFDAQERLGEAATHLPRSSSPETRRTKPATAPWQAVRTCI
jgi:CheY-like chemotaxis protein